MAIRNPLALNRSLSLVLQSGQTAEGTPYAARISLTRLSNYLLGGALVFAVTVFGTLLFFRELELNRKMQEHVLKLESERRLYQAFPLPERMLAQASPVVANAPQAIHKTDDTPKSDAGVGAEAVALARINDLRMECTEEECSIKLGMVTSQPGTAVGQLMLVLETEVPRIGGANPSTPVRKRYFVYPGNTARDELDPNQLGTLAQKSFRFTRALQTSNVFKMGKLLRPLAINAYVFDSEKTLLQHERRVTDSEE
jgi:hypothetical protein